MPFSSLILYSILPLTVPLPVIPVIWAIPETDALISKRYDNPKMIDSSIEIVKM